MIKVRALIASFVLASPALAQENAPPSFEVARVHDTGWVANPGTGPATIASFPVTVPGAAWMQLRFREIHLPEDGVALVITSVLDGSQQILSARHCREWQNHSAYFNGDDVQVEIVARPDSGPCRVILDAITAGVPPFPSFTQCGLLDDRVLSNDPRQARALPIGCTVWLIHDCRHNFLTAGHCSTASLQIVQFNVPLSDISGVIVSPPATEQYSVDPASKQSLNGGVGNDWGHFACFANPNTGLRPYQKQQQAYTLAAAAPAVSGSVTIRITGYGTDNTPPQNNQVQQTSTGPYTAHTGTRLDYQADTQGGNSGSPVLWEQQSLAIGIHTHGGCNTAGTGSNHGTAIEHVGPQNAVANPIGSAVCQGEANVFCAGKVNSQGCVETISFTGIPSASGGSGSFVITASSIINQKSGILFYGYAPGNMAWQGGVLCTSGPLRRTPALNSGGNVGPDDCSGTFAFDMGGWISGGADPNLTAGKTGFAQFWSRDPASAPFATGVTNSVQFTLGP